MTNRKIPCEVYSRIVGYLRPVSAWNVAKQEEFKDRVLYKIGQEAKKDDGTRDSGSLERASNIGREREDGL